MAIPGIRCCTVAYRAACLSLFAAGAAAGLTADLEITKDDGATTAIPGETVTYTVTAANGGPDPVAGATVADLFPGLLDCTWTCATSGAAACTAGPVAGDLIDSVDLAAGAAATYTAVCDLATSATGDLVNTATIVPPAGVDDPDPADNSATDLDALTPKADLGITKDDGIEEAVPGETVTYTLIASNSGPSDAVGAAVSDPFPSGLDCTWTCVASAGAACTAGPVAGDLVDSVDLAVGATATYTATCLIDSAATDSVVNTAAIAAPSGTTDLNGSNDSATDADTLSPQADLEITVDDGAATAIPGVVVTYTATAINHGPSDAPGAIVSDAWPVELEAVTWTCAASAGAACTTAGSGDLADTVDLPAGSSVTYTAAGTLDAAATGTLSNTATVEAPDGVPDPDSADNSASDVDQLVPTGDLAVTKDDGLTTAVPGTEVTWTITVANGGPSVIVEAAVSDAFPPEVTGVTWTCFASEGAVCGAAAGSGDIAETADLDPGAGVTYQATATFDPAATGLLSNTASAAVPAGSVDPDPDNDSATDVDTLDLQADLAITKVADRDPGIFGWPLTYTVTVINDGPGDAPSASVSDSFPGLASVTWTCSADGGATCGDGTGVLSDQPSLPVGASVTYTATGTIELDASDPLVNTATVLPVGGVTDPDAGDNSVSLEIGLSIGGDLAITKDDGRTTALVGEELSYVIGVTNGGPASVVAAEVADPFPAELEDCTWSCEATGGGECTTAIVSGDIFDTVSLPVGDSLTFLALCTVAAGAEIIVNTATVSPPGDFADPEPANDVATDVTSVPLFADGFESGDTSAWSSTSTRESALTPPQP